MRNILQNFKDMHVKKIAFATIVALAFSMPAYAETCLVADPTGTPLKYRSVPYGKVLGSLPNGTPIYINDWRIDKNGKPWVRAFRHYNNRYLGWVYYNYLSC